MKMWTKLHPMRESSGGQRRSFETDWNSTRTATRLVLSYSSRSEVSLWPHFQKEMSFELDHHTRIMPR